MVQVVGFFCYNNGARSSLFSRLVIKDAN